MDPRRLDRVLRDVRERAAADRRRTRGSAGHGGVVRARVLVTGMSGAGKSTALGALASRGHRTVDTDDDVWCEWVVDDDGLLDWVWREDAMAELLEAHTEGDLFVSGCKTNQGRLYPLFEVVVVLNAPTEVLLARIEHRDANPYGHRPEERAEVAGYVETVLPRLLAGATAVVDATRSVTSVADELEAIAAGHRRGGPVVAGPGTSPR